MKGMAVDNRFSGSVLSRLGHAEKPDLASCDALAAQCFDALPDPIKIMNAQGGIAFYNRAAFKYFGPRIAWAHLPHERDPLFHHEDLDVRRKARDKAFRLAVPVCVELRAIRYDYVARWHAFNITPLFDAGQTVTGVLIRMTDIENEPRHPIPPRLAKH